MLAHSLCYWLLSCRALPHKRRDSARMEGCAFVKTVWRLGLMACIRAVVRKRYVPCYVSRVRMLGVAFERMPWELGHNGLPKAVACAVPECEQAFFVRVYSETAQWRRTHVVGRGVVPCAWEVLVLTGVLVCAARTLRLRTPNAVVVRLSISMDHAQWMHGTLIFALDPETLLCRCGATVACV